jgi:hypothetical protein
MAQLQSLSRTVAQQKVAMEAILRRVAITTVAETASKDQQELDNLQNALQRLEVAVSAQAASIDALERRVEKMAAANETARVGYSLGQGDAGALGPLMARVAALEARSAVARVQGLSGRAGDAVAVELDADGTPQLRTAQVTVLHPTATAVDVHALMAKAGTVVSCIKRGQQPPAVPGGRPQPPCIVVTFASTHDASRAVEALDGVAFKGVGVIVRPLITGDVRAVLHRDADEERLD